MFEKDENLKDSQVDSQKDSLSTHNSYGVSAFHSGSYTKASKLVTALYMVTDIIDKDEPIRFKLRHLGAEIVSDIHSTPALALPKISETVAFLNIASAMSLISEMNANILKKEFNELSNRIKEYSEVKTNWLEEFLVTPETLSEAGAERRSRFEIFNQEEAEEFRSSNRHVSFNADRTRIGVQKGSTLMQALSEKVLAQSLRSKPSSETSSNGGAHHNFDLLKKQRREDIIRIVKGSLEGMTITDIKTAAKQPTKPAESLINCGEKTLQRELVSMVKDNLLKKTGEKRWSRYSLAK